MAKSRASYDHNLFTVSIVKLNLRKSTCLMLVRRPAVAAEPMLLGQMQMKQAAFAYIEVLIQVHVQRQSTVQLLSLSLCLYVFESVALWHATNCVWLPHRRRANIDFVPLIWYFRFRCLHKLQIAILSRTWFNSIFNYPQHTTGNRSGSMSTKWLTKESARVLLISLVFIFLFSEF